MEDPDWLYNDSRGPCEFELANHPSLVLVCFPEHETEHIPLMPPLIFDQPDFQEEVRTQSLEI